jgi:hypothetical protein
MPGWWRRLGATKWSYQHTVVMSGGVVEAAQLDLICENLVFDIPFTAAA